MQDIQDRIRGTLVRALKLEIDPEEIGEHDILFGGEIGLNSLAFIEVIVALESEFRLEIANEDLVENHFESINTMSEFIESLLSKSNQIS